MEENEAIVRACDAGFINGIQNMIAKSVEMLHKDLQILIPVENN